MPYINIKLAITEELVKEVTKYGDLRTYLDKRLSGVTVVEARLSNDFTDIDKFFEGVNDEADDIFN